MDSDIMKRGSEMKPRPPSAPALRKRINTKARPKTALYWKRSGQKNYQRRNSSMNNSNNNNGFDNHLFQIKHNAN